MALTIHPTADISRSAAIGDGTKIWHWAQVRENARIGRNCRLGKDVYIDANVVIGNDCKFQNFATVYDGVTIGNGVFVGPHVVFTNDLYPRAVTEEWHIVPTKVEDHASIGANATILCGLTIGHHAMVAAGTVVTRDVKPYALVAGVPAKRIGWVCDCGRPLDARFRCGHCQKSLLFLRGRARTTVAARRRRRRT